MMMWSAWWGAAVVNFDRVGELSASSSSTQFLVTEKLILLGGIPSVVDDGNWICSGGGAVLHEDKFGMVDDVSDMGRWEAADPQMQSENTVWWPPAVLLSSVGNSKALIHRLDSAHHQQIDIHYVFNFF